MVNSMSDVDCFMQASMGYVPGKGLGKTESGISEPIQQSMHKGRRGLGHMIAKLQQEDVQWELEEVRDRERGGREPKSAHYRDCDAVCDSYRSTVIKK